MAMLQNDFFTWILRFIKNKNSFACGYLSIILREPVPQSFHLGLGFCVMRSRKLPIFFKET